MTKSKPLNKAIASWLILALAFGPTTTIAQVGSVITTPTTPMELPIEVEIELSPAGSLKQASLWKELVQLLENPYCPVVRDTTAPPTALRGSAMPPVNMYPPGLQLPHRAAAAPAHLRRRGQLGPAGPDVRHRRGGPARRVQRPHRAAESDRAPGGLPQRRSAAIRQRRCPPTFCNGKPEGSLVVYNPGGHADIPPDGTVVAVAAFFDGMLHESIPRRANTRRSSSSRPRSTRRTSSGIRPIPPVSPRALRPLIGRPAAEILGKALFWDMQVGSDGVQSCGTLPFQRRADNRTKGQLNPDTNSGDLTRSCKSSRRTPTWSPPTSRSTSGSTPRSSATARIPPSW